MTEKRWNLLCSVLSWEFSWKFPYLSFMPSIKGCGPYLQGIATETSLSLKQNKHKDRGSLSKKNHLMLQWVMLALLPSHTWGTKWDTGLCWPVHESHTPRWKHCKHVGSLFEHTVPISITSSGYLCQWGSSYSDWLEWASRILTSQSHLHE